MKRRDHGRDCTPKCAELSEPCPIERDTPPRRPCQHCGAKPGVACVVRIHGRTIPLLAHGRFHASRTEAA